MHAPPAEQTAIVVYSFSGHSARLADKLAVALDAPVITLQAPRYSRGIFGYMRAGLDSLRQSFSKDDYPLPDLSTYRHIILCGPVWTSYPAIPVRAALQAQGGHAKPVSLFLTCGDASPPEKAYALAEQDLGRPLSVKAALPNKTEDTAEEDSILAGFLDAFSKVVVLPS